MIAPTNRPAVNAAQGAPPPWSQPETRRPSVGLSPPATGGYFVSQAEPPGPHPPVAGGLPEIPAISWEIDRDGGWECWHAPEGAKAARRTKTYLGRIGKRELKRLDDLPDNARLASIEAKVRAWREGKGLHAD